MTRDHLYEHPMEALNSWRASLLPPQRPLVRRCEGGCGQPVSNTKRRCKACYETYLNEILPLVRESILKLPPEERAQAIAGLPVELQPRIVIADSTDVQPTAKNADTTKRIILAR